MNLSIRLERLERNSGSPYVVIVVEPDESEESMQGRAEAHQGRRVLLVCTGIPKGENE